MQIFILVQGFNAPTHGAYWTLFEYILVEHMFGYAVVQVRRLDKYIRRF